MTAIVGLDLSLTSTGVAVLDVDAAGDATPILLRCVGAAGKKTDSYAQRSRRVRKQSRAILGAVIGEGSDPIRQRGIVLAVIEGPIYGGNLTGSYFDRAGLFHGVFGALDARNIPIAVVSPTTGHQFVTGRGRPIDDEKSDVIEETRKWWPRETGPLRVYNSDQGDALGLAVMGAMHLRAGLPFRPRARHFNALATVTWPDGHHIQVPAAKRG